MTNWIMFYFCTKPNINRNEKATLCLGRPCWNKQQNKLFIQYDLKKKWLDARDVIHHSWVGKSDLEFAFTMSLTFGGRSHCAHTDRCNHSFKNNCTRPCGQSASGSRKLNVAGNSCLFTIEKCIATIILSVSFDFYFVVTQEFCLNSTRDLADLQRRVSLPLFTKCFYLVIHIRLSPFKSQPLWNRTPLNLFNMDGNLSWALLWWHWWWSFHSNVMFWNDM